MHKRLFNIKKLVIKHKASIYSLLIIIVFFSIANYDYTKGYLTEDVKLIKQNLGNTNILIGVIFFLITLFLVRRKYESRKIEKSKLYSLSFYNILFTFSIFFSINEIICNTALVLNNFYTSEKTIQRTIKIGYYDHEEEEIILLANDFYKVPLEKSKYERIQNQTHIDVKLHLGLFNIPKNPIVVLN
ncbi:hypothetical protein EV195_103120 [Tenacibaculum skagerrakense]|uniref:Uncharacterized protein n=1 Tax=Tenacibaculum skagerrakense TaxID=186571 RepID=A0A4R2NVY6_9FLAO|nr:hypothetical protein [Tenacibaculum skagerrakense]TCP25761.1 hypothetical protein EV195_103120 [Tenacibaculum skagerrakense]